MKIKFTAILLIMCMCMISLSGCVKEQSLVGKDKIEALRSEAAAYESARYFITNVDTDVLEQVFTFMYSSSDKKSPQMYLCEGVQGGEYYYEYSDGEYLFREENGVGSEITPADDTYAVYTRNNPHPYSTGQLFFYVNSYVATAEETTDEQGNTLYIYNYDVEKINKSLGNTLTVFATSYAFDNEGNFVYFRQHNASDVTDESGNVTNESYTYEISVAEVNSITEIEKPTE